MNKKASLLLVPAVALGMSAFASAPAFAADGDATSYQTELGALNGSNASGTVMVTMNGDEAHVHMEVSGLAETFNDGPYPHVQHIHIGAEGTCPTMDADKNGDGIVDTVEGQPSYGMIGTTLSTSGDTSAKAATDLKVAESGGSYTYDRTFTLNADTMASLEAGTASVVVHGLDPATLSKEAQDAKSNLVPELPLAATSPALCGTLTASQMDMPNGAPLTGGGSTSTGPDMGLLALGGGLFLTAGGLVVARRRSVARSESK